MKATVELRMGQGPFPLTCLGSVCMTDLGQAVRLAEAVKAVSGVWATLA